MSDNGDSYEPDASRVQENARRRKHERTETVEDVVARTTEVLAEEKYPVRSEELATEYADEVMDLPNETESLGSVFDRMVGERFESPDEAREAVLSELTGEAAGPEEYNDERPLDDFEDEDQQLG